MPALNADLTTARMTAFRPGASPPPVRIPMRLIAVMRSTIRRPLAQHLESRKREPVLRLDEKLFDDPLDAEPSWPAFAEVVRDPSRNFLFNHLGLNEDAKISLRPDCADLPYTLRAYFAYKMGLPYGFSKCSRGSGGKAPTCPQWFSLQNAEEAKPPPPPVAAPIPPTASGYFGFSSAPAPPGPKRTGPAPSFAELVQIVSDSVHSGSARTALADNNTDYYPVPLSGHVAPRHRLC